MIVDDLKDLTDKCAAIMADTLERLDDLERRVAAIERSVVIVPGGNPTERTP